MTLPLLVLDSPSGHAHPAHAAALLVDEEILALIGVTVRTVGSLYLLCGDTFAAQDVFSVGDGLKMLEVTASPVPAEMIDDQSFGNGSNEVLVDDAVNRLRPALAFCDSVSFVCFASRPFPATILMKDEAKQDVLNRVFVPAGLARTPRLGNSLGCRFARTFALLFPFLSRRLPDPITSSATAVPAASYVEIVAGVLMTTRTMGSTSALCEAPIAQQDIASMINWLKMVWIRAPAVPACMMQYEPLRNHALHAFIDKSMNANPSSLANKNPISAIGPARPEPAPRFGLFQSRQGIIDPFLLHTRMFAIGTRNSYAYA